MTDEGLLEAFRSFGTAVDGLWTALQKWADGRRLSSSPLLSPVDVGPDAAAAGVPAPRANAQAAMTEPSR